VEEHIVSASRIEPAAIIVPISIEAVPNFRVHCDLLNLLLQTNCMCLEIEHIWEFLGPEEEWEEGLVRGCKLLGISLLFLQGWHIFLENLTGDTKKDWILRPRCLPERRQTLGEHPSTVMSSHVRE
jgi:hypothetical protein